MPVKADISSTHADLNGDGFVNVLDAAILRLGEFNGSGAVSHSVTPSGQAAQAAGTERVIVEPLSMTIIGGGQATVLFLLHNNTTPLLGYTLQVTPQPLAGAEGAMIPNVSASNFADQGNVITAGGATRDPYFSVIQDDGSGGVSISTMTDDLSTVLAVDGVNDVLAEVVFDVPPDVDGDFLVTLGPSSAISDEN